jgi:hypothetical protein
MVVAIQAQKSPDAKLKDMLNPPKGKGNQLTKAEQAEVDEFAQLNEKLVAMAADIKRHDTLKKSLSEIASERFDKSVPALLKGQVAEVEFGACGSKREIADMNGMIGLLRDKIGYDALVGILSVTLGNVDKYLTVTESKKFVDADPVGGSRKLAAVRFKK